ncbi:hypothetical protein SAMN05428984_2625 [Sphingomonas sp. OK281]|nr:hypothetical protein SAMN05428984_2625 [Sphingomonas sp. OK281]
MTCTARGIVDGTGTWRLSYVLGVSIDGRVFFGERRQYGLV